VCYIGLQGNGYTYGIKSKVVVGYDFRDCGQEDGGFFDELNKHKNGYMFFCEHPKSIYGASQVSSFGHNKICDEVP
jgi:hypothetical protein